MELEEQIIALLTENPGQKAREVAKKLGVSRKQVNSLLHGPLQEKFVKDEQFLWWLPEEGKLNQTTSPEPTRNSTQGIDVRRQNLLNLELPELRDTLAHQVGM